MPSSTVRIHAARSDPRTHEIFVSLGACLRMDAIVPDARGTVTLLIDRPPAEATALIRGSLSEVAPDWPDRLQVETASRR